VRHITLPNFADGCSADLRPAPQYNGIGVAFGPRLAARSLALHHYRMHDPVQLPWGKQEIGASLSVIKGLFVYSGKALHF
jgi:hypothetical protein